MAGIDAGAASMRWREATLALGAEPAKLQFGAEPNDSRPAHLRYLKQICSKILARAFDYRDPMAQKNDWIHFSANMHWATMHPDSGRDEADRVVVFVTTYPQPVGGNDLVLLGSTCHLLDRVGSVGRMGSTSDTLYELASDEGLIDRRSAGLSWEAAEAAVHLDRIVTDEGPRWQVQKVEGLAKVLHLIDEGNVTRTVVATPLYVRICDPASSRSRRLASKRRKHIERHGVEFIPAR